MGDVAICEPGDTIPCDGVILQGHNLKCDESAATGESDAIKKMTLEHCVETLSEGNPGPAHTDCVLVSGSKVLEGVGKYVIVAVGTKCLNGRITMGTY